MAINIAGANQFSSRIVGWIARSTVFEVCWCKMGGFEFGKSCEVQRVTQILSQRDAQLAMWQAYKLFQMAINIAGGNRFSSRIVGWIANSTAFESLRCKMGSFEVGKSCEVQRVTQTLSQRDAQLAMRQGYRLFSYGHKYSGCEPI
jgi:hypothetical protein